MNSKMDSQSFSYFCAIGLSGNMPFSLLECEFKVNSTRNIMKQS